MWFPDHAVASLDRLRKYQRTCFDDIQPCIMFMDEKSAYGCFQCGDDIRQQVVREIVQRDELLRFLKSNEEPRIIMIPEYLFFLTRVLNALVETKTVAAVVVYPFETISTPLPFPPLQVPFLSTDSWDPNDGYNYYPEPTPSDDPAVSPLYERNSVGNGLKYKQYPFNIFRINATAADTIRNRMKRFPELDKNKLTVNGLNKSSPTSPRYKLQSIGQMYACPSNTATPTPSAEGQTDIPPAPMNSKTCLGNNTCLPIGGQSVWSALGWLNPSVPNERKKILAITAPMDSIAFFPDGALGASAEVASVAVLLAVAEAVATYRRSDTGASRTMEFQPVYFLWNAQSWGYAGSSRFLRDVRDFNCTEEEVAEQGESGCKKPFMKSLKFKDFKDADFTVLNIGQLTAPVSPERRGQGQSYYVYRVRPDNTSMTALKNILEDQFSGSQLRLESAKDVALIPLDASQSFHRYTSDAEVLSVTNYGEEFENKLYHSIYDNITLMDRRPLQGVAEVIASSVVNFAFGANVSVGDVTVNETIIDQFLDCIVGEWKDCGLAEEYMELDVYKKIEEDKNISGNYPVSSGNYPGSFFPVTRLSKVNPSGAVKLALIRSFLAYHNRYRDDSENGERQNTCTATRDDATGDATSDCKEFEKDLNAEFNPSTTSTQSELRISFCAKRICVASVTHMHNAFGTALLADSGDQTTFELVKKDPESSEPSEGGWTESVWDEDLGLCGFVEDTPLFGNLILGSGIAVLIASALFVFLFDRMMFKTPADEEEREPLTPSEPSV